MYLCNNKDFRYQVVSLFLFGEASCSFERIATHLADYPLFRTREQAGPNALLGVEIVALGRFVDMEDFSFSSDLGDRTTAGFGSLDGYGNWEYPLPFELIELIMFAQRWRTK